jgi:hypothetical protein
LYFKRLSAKKGKSRHTFWTAERAVVVAPLNSGPERIKKTEGSKTEGS